MALQLSIAIAIFAAIALLSPRLFDALSPRAGRPHRHFILVFRIWFGILALATFLLLLRPHLLAR